MAKKRTAKIKNLKAREILDSRGNPTIEVALETSQGVFVSSVPSGASKGKYEALELRDGDKQRYNGKGVQKAAANINKSIAPKLKRKDPTQQQIIDELMIKMDGTENKSKLGANAILAVSMAVCRAGAAAKGMPLWKHISQISGVRKPGIPVPSALLIEGGLHAGNKLDFQEFMIVPSAGSFKEGIRKATEIYHTLGSILRKECGESAINVGYEGGYAPSLRGVEETLNLITKAVKETGNDSNIKFALDVAASSFCSGGIYKLEDNAFTREGLLGFYSDIIKKFPIISLEDPFDQDDSQGFKEITEKLSGRIIIIGDDLLVTNIGRIKKAAEENLCTGLLLKPNQIGTITETIKAAQIAEKNKWALMVSHRSGETSDDFIADLAVGLGAGFIKAGAPCRGERVAKYNRLLEIEEEIHSGK